VTRLLEGRGFSLVFFADKAGAFPGIVVPMFGPFFFPIDRGLPMCFFSDDNRAFLPPFIRGVLFLGWVVAYLPPFPPDL